MNEVMTVAELATYLRFNKITIYRLIRKKELPAVRVGRNWRLRSEDVEGWIARQSTQREGVVAGDGHDD